MEKTELPHLEEIRARYNDNGLSPDEYRAMPISEMAKMRMDVKRLLLYIDRIRTPSPDNKALTCDGCVSFGDGHDHNPCFGCKRAVRENDCYRRQPEKGD